MFRGSKLQYVCFLALVLAIIPVSAQADTVYLPLIRKEIARTVTVVFNPFRDYNDDGVFGFTEYPLPGVLSDKSVRIFDPVTGFTTIPAPGTFGASQSIIRIGTAYNIVAIERPVGSDACWTWEGTFVTQSLSDLSVDLPMRPGPC